jgi:exodeoxyribonuclease VII small subunit
MKYENAVKELQQIIQQLEGDEVNLDKLLSNVQRAKELLTFCKSKLRSVEHEIDEVL